MSEQYSNVFEGELPALPLSTASPTRTELQKRLCEAAEAPQYFLVEIPEDNPPQVTGFETIQALAQAVIALRGQDTAIFMFVGHEIHRTLGDFKHLLTPLGAHPLYEIPDVTNLEIDRNPFLGTPLPLPAPAPPEPIVRRDRRPLRAIDVAERPTAGEEESNIFPESDA